MRESNYLKENLSKIKVSTKIVAVSKGVSLDTMIMAYNLGIRDFGENKVQEALEKINSLPKKLKDNTHFHFIGHLQSNKVKLVVGSFCLIHSVDSLKLAKEISKVSVSKGITQQILLQVNNANEKSKYGFSKEELYNSFQEIIKLPNIEVKGLMNIAPLGIGSEQLRELFKGMRLIKEDLEKKYKYKLSDLSMGMSDDYKEAIKEGATIIRIGRKIFNE